MSMKPQDIFILLKLVVLGSRNLPYSSLAKTLNMSPSEVHAGLLRSQHSRLYSDTLRRPVHENLLEFLVHGLKYVFPAEIGGATRGMPTAYAASPLKDHLTISSDEMPPVWPTPVGPVIGLTLVPLYPSVPLAAANDRELYMLLALVDALRFGRSRDHAIAVKLLSARLNNKTVNQ